MRWRPDGGPIKGLTNGAAVGAASVRIGAYVSLFVGVTVCA
jgi:hypothetical protein